LQRAAHELQLLPDFNNLTYGLDILVIFAQLSDVIQQFSFGPVSDQIIPDFMISVMAGWATF